MIFATLALLALVVLPLLLGRLIFELGVPDESPVRGWPLTERLFAELAMAWVCLLWIGLVLLQTGAFTALNLAGIAVVLIVLLGAQAYRTGQRLFAGVTWKPDYTVVVVAGLLLAGSVWYTPRLEQIIGARDPTAYVLAGVSMAREGGLVYVDEMIRDMPESAWLDFLGPDSRGSHAHYGPQFLGWYLIDPELGNVVPHGLPLYPSSIAIGYWVAGIKGALGTTTLLAIASVIAMFFVGRQLAGVAVGISAAALLLVSPAQVWYSRFANAEAMTQLLVIAGLYGMLVFRRHQAPAYGLLAGIAFGLSWQAHIWMVWLVLPLGGLLVSDLLSGRLARRDVVVFWGPLFVLGVHALVVYATFARPYLSDILLVIRDSPWTLLPLVAAVVLLLLALWVGRRRRTAGERSDASAKDQEAKAGESGLWTASSIRWAFAVALLALGLYALWLRPVVATGWRARSVTRLILATTPVAYLLAIAGGALLILQRRRRTATLSCLAVLIVASIPVLVEPNILPGLMWSLRRYQPTVFPAVFLLAAVAIWWLPEWLRRRAAENRRLRWQAKLGVVGAVAATAVLVSVLAVMGSTYRGFTEPGHAIDMIEAIHESVEENAVLVFEARSGWRVLDFAPALEFWKGHEVIWLRRKNTDSEVFRSFVLRQARRGKPVYFFTQGFNYLIAEPRMVPHRRWWFDHHELGPNATELPDVIHENRIAFTSYRVELGGGIEPLDRRLDIGVWDAIYVGEMYPPESDRNGFVRWTKGVGWVWLPGLDETATQIIVNLTTFLPPDGTPRMLRVTLDDVVLGEVELEQRWRNYIFDIPSTWQPSDSVPKLELSTEPMRPAEVVGGTDRRYLGVRLDTVEWR